MPLATNGKISTTDQQVDQDKYSSNHDEINWKSKQTKEEQDDNSK